MINLVLLNTSPYLTAIVIELVVFILLVIFAIFAVRWVNRNRTKEIPEHYPWIWVLFIFLSISSIIVTLLMWLISLMINVS